MEEIIRRVKALARECGEILKNADRKEFDIDVKEGHANFVTKYDKLVQERLEKGLKEIMPESGFYGEEGKNESFPQNEYVFIVDPIDGTTNFMKNLPLSCIAIGLVKNKERIFGLVYNPFTDEMFTAKKGEGAFLNEERIRVSSKPLEMGLVIFGTAPYHEGLPKLALDKALYFMDKCIDVRRLGSAELDLCFVACGRAELYFEPILQPWDYAAGSLIVEEAGGVVKCFDGSALDVTKPQSCIAFGRGVNIDKF